MPRVWAYTTIDESLDLLASTREQPEIPPPPPPPERPILVPNPQLPDPYVSSLAAHGGASNLEYATPYADKRSPIYFLKPPGRHDSEGYLLPLPSNRQLVPLCEEASDLGGKEDQRLSDSHYVASPSGFSPVTTYSPDLQDVEPGTFNSDNLETDFRLTGFSPVTTYTSDPQTEPGPSGFSPVTTYSSDPQAEPGPSGYSPVTTYTSDPQTVPGPSGYSPVTTYTSNPQVAPGPSGYFPVTTYTSDPQAEPGPSEFSPVTTYTSDPPN